MDTETSTYIDSIVDRRIILALDLFGTLLSTESTSKKLSEYYADKANAISAQWRRYQLEYTWRLNSMSIYEPFDVVTEKALLHALSEAGVTPDPSTVTSIMQSYASLSPFPDVAACLSSISSIKHIHPIIFTNGTPTMVQDALKNTPELELLTKVRNNAHLCANEIEKYKPHPMIYQFLAAKVGKSINVGVEHGGIDEVVLVTANPFDIVGAQAVGVTGVWVDRTGGGWHDGLVKDGPKVTIKSLEKLKGVIDEIIAEKEKVWERVEKESKEKEKKKKKKRRDSSD